MRHIVAGTVRPPLQPATVPFSDKWGGSSTGPIHRAVRRVGFLVGAIVVLHVPATVPESIHPDKYKGPNIRVVRPPKRPFFSQARTITFTQMFPLDWADDHARVMRPARQFWYDKSTIDPFILAQGETITFDKWKPSLGRVVPRPPRLPYFEQSVLQSLSTLETVGLDKFEPPNSRVVRLVPRPFFSQARTITFSEMFPLDWAEDEARVMLPARRFWYDKSTIDPGILGAAERGQIDKWIGSREGAPRGPLTFRRDHPCYMEGREPIEALTIDKWDDRSGKIMRPPRLTKYPDPVIQLDTFTERASVDKFYASPVPEIRRAPRLMVGTSVLARELFGETITLDKWRGSTPERSRLPAPIPAYPGSVLQIFEFPATVTLDQWIPARIERSRPAEPLKFYPGPVLQIAFFDEFSGPDKWLGIGVPAHRAIRAVRGDTFSIENPIESVTLDKYIGVLPRIPERLRLWRYTDPVLHLDFFAERESIDKWLESGQRPHIFGRVVRPTIIEHPSAEAGSPVEDISLDKWLHDWRVTRPAPRLFIYPPPILVLTDAIAIVPGEPAPGLDLQVIKNLRQTSTTPDVIRYGSQTSGSQTKRDAIAVAMQNRFKRDG